MENRVLFWEKANSIRKLCMSLQADKISVVATDTVLGLLSNITKKGFLGLNQIKKRSEKSYIILINSIEKLPLFTDINLRDKKLINLLKNCWPGPVTIIFKCKENLPDYIKNFQKTIAIRIPNHTGLLQLLTFFDGLFSTSANLSGEKIPETLDDLNSQILNFIDYLVINENSLTQKNSIIPSTIISYEDDKFKLVREGAYPIKKLEEYYGDKFIV